MHYIPEGGISGGGGGWLVVNCFRRSNAHILHSAPAAARLLVVPPSHPPVRSLKGKKVPLPNHEHCIGRWCQSIGFDHYHIISFGVELDFNLTRRETSQRRSFYIDSLCSHCQDKAKTGCLKIWCQTNAAATRIPELQTFGIMSELLAHIITKRIQCMIAIVFCLWFANHCLVSTLHDQIWQL